MALDLNDLWGWLQRLIRRVERLESGAFLENSSITSGRMRFIGGTLRVDSGGAVEIVGSLEIDGSTTINGAFTLTASSAWSIEGDGTIAGDVTITGVLKQNGLWELNGNGKITGDVELSGDLAVKSAGEIRVEGSNPIVLYQSGGLARMDLGSTAQIWSGGDGVTISAAGGGFINVYSDGVDIGGAGEVTRISNQVRMTNVGPVPGGVTAVPLLVDPSTGVVYR